MIGVFDSGVGGICAFREIRRLLPRADLVYLADRKNSPYGTKTKDEIISLTSKNIKILRSIGADRVLIACCTASSVYSMLCDEDRAISTPIITPAAELASSFGERIAVIATEHTAKSGVFSREISSFSSAEVFEFAEQRLVALVEDGCRDGRINEECEEILMRIGKTVGDINADTLILGCTHFSHLESELSKRCGIRIVSPAREGARALVKMIKTDRRDCGRIIYM